MKELVKIRSQPPERWFGSFAQSYWLPANIWRRQDESPHGQSSSVQRGACAQHLITAPFGTHVDVDTMVVGVMAQKRWKGFTCIEVKPHCHRTAAIMFSLHKCCDNCHNFILCVLEVRVSTQFRCSHGTTDATHAGKRNCPNTTTSKNPIQCTRLPVGPEEPNLETVTPLHPGMLLQSSTVQEN